MNTTLLSYSLGLNYLRGCTPEVFLEISVNIKDILDIFRYLNSLISQAVSDMVRYLLRYLKISQIDRDIF